MRQTGLRSMRFRASEEQGDILFNSGSASSPTYAMPVTRLSLNPLGNSKSQIVLMSCSQLVWAVTYPPRIYYFIDPISFINSKLDELTQVTITPDFWFGFLRLDTIRNTQDAKRGCTSNG